MKKLSFTFIILLALTASAQNFVDLGLPSGILWADANEPGVYTFDESAAAFRGNEMPGMYEFKELEETCTWRWNGTGYTVIGPNGDSIVFPMVQTKWCTGEMETGTSGHYWSAEVYDDLEAWGLYFSEGMISTQMSFARCQGLPVRKIQHPARTFHRPDYEWIQSIGKKEYKKLMKRFYAADTTLTLSEIQAIYFGSAFYGYLSLDFDQRDVMKMLDQGKNHKEIVKFIDKHLEKSPVDLRALLFRAIVAQIDKDEKAVDKYGKMFRMLVYQAILETGDGDSDTTGWHVVSVADEYTLLWYVLQVQIESQVLTSSECDMFNIITKSGRHNQIYFDVQLVLALEHRMFSDSKEPFHFTYIPQTGESKPVAGMYPGSKDNEIDVIEIDDSVDESEELQTPLMDEEGNYLTPDIMPQFPGGQDSLLTFLSANVKYPKELGDAHISGRVIVQFIVDTDGAITDVVVVRSSGEPLLDKEAMRVVKIMPNWIPGQNEEKPVRVRYTIPINFKLQDSPSHE